MISKDNILIGQMLVDEGLITPGQLDQGLLKQQASGDFICAALIKLGFVSEEKVFNVLSCQLNIPYVKLKEIDIQPLVIKKVPAKFVSHYKLVPYDFKYNFLYVAMTDPLDVRILDDIKLLLGFEVKGALASEDDIRAAIRKYYGVGAETVEQIIAQKPQAQESELEKNIEDLETLAEDASIIKFVNQVLTEAINDRATDVHLEPFQNELRVRYRIDGLLYDINVPQTVKYFHQAIVSRIKIMSKMNIAEKRIPQDGRIKIKVNEQELDLRVSVIPTVFGESVQIRILSSGQFLELTKLGLSQDNLKIIRNLITRQHGIIFVTGPTGSGKSTTLYAALAEINSSSVKIITIEDPVEYQLRGINQIQVKPEIGFTFAAALRHMLRHDPDVMMVGEVRDAETAEIAIRSALTGHLVFSTLHTNDAAGAVTRLLDMGIEPFLVSSSLECLIAQRLIRLLCVKCKVPLKSASLALEEIKRSGLNAEGAQLYDAVGCKDCRFTGYYARTAIYEIITVLEPIREMILNRASSQQIKQRAVSLGMKTLRQDGLAKVLQGLTTITEVLRVTQQEELPE